MGCMHANYIFERYLNKLKQLPEVPLLVTAARAGGKWTEIEQYLRIILRDSKLKAILDSDLGPSWNEIGMYVDFTWGIVDPLGATMFWQQYIPEFEDPPTFIPNADLRYMLDNYWNIDAMIKRFTGAR